MNWLHWLIKALLIPLAVQHIFAAHRHNLVNVYIVLNMKYISSLKLDRTRCFTYLKLSSFGEPEPTVAQDYCSWLKLDVVLCYCRLSASRFGML